MFKKKKKSSSFFSFFILKKQKMLSLRHEPMDDFFQVHNTTDYGELYLNLLGTCCLPFLLLASTESQSFISLPHLRSYTSEENKHSPTVTIYH